MVPNKTLRTTMERTDPAKKINLSPAVIGRPDPARDLRFNVAHRNAGVAQSARRMAIPGASK
jgi:hypothetical protein